MSAPAVKHNPFTTVAVFTVGVFVETLLENAYSEDDKREKDVNPPSSSAAV
jgi:hypothetical protein